VPLSEHIMSVIHDAGYSTGTTSVLKLDTGELVAHVNAIHPKTMESWSVIAPTEYQAAVELAVQLGFELEE